MGPVREILVRAVLEYILNSGKEQYSVATYIGEYSNHEAEFIAVIRALEYCKIHFPKEIISCRSDAKIVVDAIEKQYVKNTQFQPYLAAIRRLANAFPYFFMKWIPEKQNVHADRLARNALKQK